MTRAHRKRRVAPQRRILVGAPAAPELAPARAALHGGVGAVGAQPDAFRPIAVRAHLAPGSHGWQDTATRGALEPDPRSARTSARPRRTRPRVALGRGAIAGAVRARRRVPLGRAARRRPPAP